jgi:hypothetical protein
LVDLQSFDIVPHVLGINGAVDKIEEPDLAKGTIKEGTLGRECSVTIVNGDCHMVVDVDMLDHRGCHGGRGRFGKMVLGSGGRGSGVGCHGRCGGRGGLD